MARRQCFPRIDAPPPMDPLLSLGIGDDVQITLDLMKIAGRKRSKGKSKVRVVTVTAGRAPKARKKAKNVVKKTTKKKGEIALEVARVSGATRPRTFYKSSRMKCWWEM